MTKAIQYLNSKMLETLNWTQAEMKMELKKNAITENSKGSLASRMNQAEARLSGLKDKESTPNKQGLQKKFKTLERNIQEMWGIMKKKTLGITVMDKGEEFQVNGIH